MDALTKTSGPCIVLAGAGTGKTRLMVDKVEYLIKNNICPAEKIVCITFSNEAANNLSSRIRARLKSETEPITKTFHSFSAHLLKEHLPKEKQNFATLTPDDAKILLHTNLRVPPANCHRYIDSIGKAKDIGITIESLKKYFSTKTHNKPVQELKEELEALQNLILSEDKKEKKKALSNEAIRIKELLDLARFITVFEAYEKIKDKKNLLDYSDLNNKAVELLNQKPLIAEEFHYIVVDEFQDTNRIQLELLRLLCPKKNITIVGDINQSIYRFRGAYEANISAFKKIFDVKPQDIFTLEKSYRSPNKILKIANQLIKNNYYSQEDCLFVKNAFDNHGENIQVIETKNAHEEARRIVEIIKEKIPAKKPEEICVMARTHQQLAVIKKALSESGIEFHSIGKESLLKQASIKKIISYLTIVNNLVKKNNKGWSAWWDLANNEELPKEDFIKITELLKENRDSPNYNVKIFTSLNSLETSPEAKPKIHAVISRIKLLIPEANLPLNKLIEKTFNTCGYASEELIKIDKEALLNINKFQEFAARYRETHSGDLEEFVNYLEVLNLLGITVEAARIEDKGVRLMTAHSTKGLEYETVILTNLAQKRFPIERLSRNKLLPDELIKKGEGIKDIEEYERQNQMSEERRLCYVSFTRSKSELILTYAGEYAGKKTEPSQFLEEINYKNNPVITFIEDHEEKSLRLSENTDQIPPAKEISIKEKTLSPSALTLFENCQKKFEYKYVYNMPGKITTSWEALKVGSFVHLILEKGVKNNFKKLEEFINLVKDLKLNEEWESIDLEEVIPLVKIFYERNKSKYTDKSLTEQKLFATISDLEFMGIADRIDFLQDGLEIIDYKTGKTIPTGKDRNIQLGYYALAAKKLGKVKKLTLDVFQNPQPLEFAVKDNGDVISLASNHIAFNIHEVEAQLTEIGNKIKDAYKNGFKPCPVEKGCEFCNEYVY